MSGFKAKCIGKTKTGDLVGIDILDDGMLTVSPISQDAEWANHLAMSARDIEKGELVEYNPLGNTDDILVRGLNYEKA